MPSAVPPAVHRPSVRAGVLAALLALLLPVLVVTPASAGIGPCPLDGDGSTADPFRVATAEHLALVGAIALQPSIYDCDLDDEYRQTADIALPAPASGSSSNHTPIGGFGSDQFTGVYDGGGHSITGLIIDLSSVQFSSAGLFHSIGPAGEVRDLRLVDVEVKADSAAGALAAYSEGSVSRVSVSGNSRVEANIVAAGGLVGEADGFGSITASWASASVTASTTDTSQNSTRGAGGLLGVNRSCTTISDSFATGSVTNPAGVAAGLVGLTGTGCLTVERSYATGRVIGATTGDVTTSGLVGGIFGPPTVTASFWDSDTTQQSTSHGSGTGLTTADMKAIATYTGASTPWAIVPRGVGGASDVWGICELVNDGYPFLLWEVAGAASDPCGSQSEQVTGSSAAASFVAPGGVLPLVAAGSGEWVQADGSSTPLAVSSPGVNQVRYAADGIVVTFTGGAGSDVSRGLVANPAGEVVCEVCVEPAAGQVIEAWMFSTPRLVAAHLTEDLPCQRFAIPVVAPLDGGGPVAAGAHTLQLALPTASGMQAVNVGVTVGGPVPGSVPAGEGPAVPVGLVALGLLAAAGAVVAARRQVTAG